MAIAGDIIIKLAADFAEFAKGMADSTKAIGDFGKKVEEQNVTIEGLAKSIADLGKSNSVEAFTSKLEALGKSFIKFGLIGAAAAAVIGSIVAAIQKGRDIEDYANKIDKLANSLKLTTLNAQALEFAARATGKTAEELNAQLSKAQQAQLASIYKAAFGDTTKILEDVSKASTRLSDAFGDLKEQSHQAMVAMFGGLTEGVINALADAILIWSAAIRDASSVLARVAKSPQLPSVSSFIESGQNVGAGIGGGFPTMDAGPIATQADIIAEKVKTTTAQLEELRKKLKDTEAELADTGDRGGVLADDMANLAKRIAEVTAELVKLTIAQAGTAATALTPFAGKGFTPPSMEGKGPNILQPYIPGATQATRWMIEGLKPLPTGGGGGGRSDNENIEAQIKRYEALAAVAERAGKTISANREQNIDDLQREVRVQQQVEEIAAKLGAKYSDADKALKDRLHDEIALYERRKDANQQFLQDLQRAQELEIKYGDGVRAREQMERDLNKAKQTGVVTTEALARAEAERSEQLEHQRLQAQRYDNSLNSLAAGFQDAALSYARSNDLFAQGGQIFSSVTQAMGDSLDVLVGQSSKTFNQIASDFAMMLAKMALQAALSPVFKLIGNAFSSYFGQGGGTTPPVLTDTGSFPTARAGGGSVYGGQPYWVGEYGPERFVPAGAGRIDPAGGGDVFVSIANYTDASVSAKKSKGPGGQTQVDVIVEMVEGKMSQRLSRGQGALGRTMEGKYGLQQVGR